METTIEVRWFIPGSPPENVQSWFSQGCPGKILDSPDTRQDQYLCLPECAAINLKLRDGESLELKWRQMQLGMGEFSHPQTLWQGKIERWCKWTYSDAEGSNLLSSSLFPHQSWITVDKHRQQRSYRGVSGELTSLQLEGKNWWSLAFEMIEPQSEDNLFDQVLQQFCQTSQGLNLKADQSYSYSSWLIQQKYI